MLKEVHPELVMIDEAHFLRRGRMDSPVTLYDHDAERAIVGSIVDCYINVLDSRHKLPNPEWFHHPFYRRIYSAAYRIRKRGDYPGANTVSCVDELKKCGQDKVALKELQDEFGAMYISLDQWPKIMDGSPCSRSWEDSYQSLEYCYKNRREHELREEIASLPLEEISKRVEEHQHSNNGNEDFSKYDPHRYSDSEQIKDEKAVLTLDGHNIAFPSNLVSVYAQAKQGKTAVIGAMLAALITEEDSFSDCLGFESAADKGKALIYLDADQPRNDFLKTIRRAKKRAGIEIMPKCLRATHLLPFSIKERKEFLLAEIEKANKDCNGILAVFLDGGADFINNVNDPDESDAAIAELLKLAMVYDCVFVVVLHENPGQTTGKMRGWYGSQLERKTGSNLRVVKEGDTHTVYTDRSRHCNIPKEHGHTFEWNNDEKDHITCGKEPTRGAKNIDIDEIMELMPPAPIEILRVEFTNDLHVKKNLGINKAKHMVSILVDSMRVNVIRKPRAGTKPAEFLVRKPLPER